jgi:hypothetical protein
VLLVIRSSQDSSHFRAIMHCKMTLKRVINAVCSAVIPLNCATLRDPALSIAMSRAVLRHSRFLPPSLKSEAARVRAIGAHTDGTCSPMDQSLSYGRLRLIGMTPRMPKSILEASIVSHSSV